MGLEHTQGAELLKLNQGLCPYQSKMEGGSIDSQGSRHIPSLPRANLDSHPPEDSRCLGTARGWISLTPWSTIFHRQHCSCIWGIDPLDFCWGKTLMEGLTRPHGASWPLG